MPLNKIKHAIAEIDGVRCSVVETGATEERAAFLKELLDHNNFFVKVAEEKKKAKRKRSLSELPIFSLTLSLLFMNAH